MNWEEEDLEEEEGRGMEGKRGEEKDIKEEEGKREVGGVGKE